jgi:solute carrier family 45 protein 1/2/4
MQPYLLSLGLSKSLMALVWIAGPLSGALVQPYIGIRSDNSRMAWGKRRPFMIAGGLATIVSLLALAWTRELVRVIMGIFGADPESKAVKNTIIVVAVLFVYVLDFAINTGKTMRRLLAY